MNFSYIKLENINENYINSIINKKDSLNPSFKYKYKMFKHELIKYYPNINIYKKKRKYKKTLSTIIEETPISICYNRIYKILCYLYNNIIAFNINTNYI